MLRSKRQNGKNTSGTNMSDKTLDITKMVDELGQATTAAKVAYEEYERKRTERDRQRSELMETLQALDLRSAKTWNFTASMRVTPRITVTHEQSVMDWLKESPNVEADAYIHVDKTAFKPLALKVLKDSGEIIPGVQVDQIESISIRENKV